MTKRVAALAAVAFAVLPGVAHAAGSKEEMKACIAAFDQGQSSQKAHHLKLAQTQLLACTNEGCPSVLRADCAEVLRSVESAMPTVVLAADDAGRDVNDVKVMSGIDTIAPSLDGKAIELDPGTYDFKFSRGINTPITVHFVLAEGEKNRIVKASFNPKKPDLAVRMETPPRTTVGWVVPGIFAALGVGGFVFAGVTRLKFNSRVDQDMTTCAPNCQQDERDSLSGQVVRSNIGLGIGIGAAVLAAASWFILGPTPRPVSRPANAALAW